MSTAPVFLFAYANDRADDRKYLRNLPEERRRIKRALRLPCDAGRCEIVVCPNATVDEVLDECQRTAGRLVLFHFAGHADGRSLLFEDTDGRARKTGASPVAEFLGGLSQLHMVVLNGCSTRAQVDELLRRGVEVVVATSAAIRDDVATEFAARFYRALAASATVRDAFDQASGAVRVKFGATADAPKSMRGLLRDVSADETSGSPALWSIHGSDETLSRVLLKPTTTTTTTGCTRTAWLTLGAGAVGLALATYFLLSHLWGDNSSPVSGCTITIRNPIVALKSEPSWFSQDIIKVKPGAYKVIRHTTKRLFILLGTESWYYIEAGGREGWVRNDTWTIEEKTSDCP